MDRVAIFAHYDSQNKIDDYVLFYLEELQKVCKNIIFVSCCNLTNEELNKLNCHKVAEVHKEYDFGSYKRGFLYAKKNHLLENIDELVFVNDSCFGPFKPLDKIFKKMERNQCDFWGLTKNKYGFKFVGERLKDIYAPHIQSYFFVLRSEVFNSETFENFINSIKVESDKNTIITKYEIGMTTILEQAGFKSDYAIKKFYKYNNPTVYKWKKLYKNSDFPFVKCSLLRLKNTLHTTVDGWHKLFTEEQVNLIEKNLEYTRRKQPIKHFAPRFVKEFVFNILPNKKMKMRILSRLFLKTIGSFLTD